MGLSETVLIYETHIACMGGLEVFLERYPQQKSHFCERKSLWKHSPQRRRSAVSPWAWMPSSFSRCSRMRWQRLSEQVKAAYPHCTIIAAGNLTEENVAEYAATGVDGLVSSAFYRAEPIQMQAQFHTN